MSLVGHGVERWRMLKKLFRGQQPVFDSAVNSLSLSLVQFSCSLMSDPLRPHELQHTRLPCPSPAPGIYSNLCSLSRWCHPTISSSVVPFSSCLSSFQASGSFQMIQLFASDGHSIGASTSALVLLMNFQSWFPLGLTDLMILVSRGLSRVFSNTTVRKHLQHSTFILWSNFHINTWLLIKP